MDIPRWLDCSEWGFEAPPISLAFGYIASPLSHRRKPPHVSCRSSFVLTREMVEAAIKKTRPGKSVHLVDIAVPRDIDPGVDSIQGVSLNNIDDVQSVVDDSVSKRSRYVGPAERVIREQIDGFMEWMSVRSASDSIRLMRERANSIRLSELDWAMPKLAGLSPSEREVVEQFSNRLVNKLLHTPTLRLREVASTAAPDSPSALVQYIFDKLCHHEGCDVR